MEISLDELHVYLTELQFSNNTMSLKDFCWGLNIRKETSKAKYLNSASSSTNGILLSGFLWLWAHLCQCRRPTTKHLHRLSNTAIRALDTPFTLTLMHPLDSLLLFPRGKATLRTVYPFRKAICIVCNNSWPNSDSGFSQSIRSVF